MGSLARTMRVIGAVALKDIRSALTERAFTIVSIIIPLNFLLLFLLFVLTGGEAPTAVVMEERGPYAQQFLAALQGAHSFIVQQVTMSEAQQLMQQGRIVAIVTVPASFDADLLAGRQVQLPVVVNNLDVDFTNDIRRAVPLAITSFYANAFPDQVVVHAQERDSYPRDTGYVQYLSVSLVVIGLMLGGLLQAGIGSAREYERGTIKELLLAPVNPWLVQLGKGLGALVLSALPTAVVLAVVIGLLGLRPAHWGELIGDSFLLMVLFVALGTLLGSLLRRWQAVVPLSFGLALPIFFLSGAFGPANWGDAVVAAVARWEPVSYGIGLLQHAFHGFQTTQTGLLADTLILGAFTVVGLGISAAVLGTGGVEH